MSTKFRNLAPILVEQFADQGGLYQRILLFLFFGRVLVSFSGSYFITKLYPQLFKAFWYWGMASLSTFSLAEILESLLFTASGIFFKIQGGWLLFLLTYVGVSLLFMNGLNRPVFRSRVTSRKWTTLRFASIVTES